MEISVKSWIWRTAAGGSPLSPEERAGTSSFIMSEQPDDRAFCGPAEPAELSERPVYVEVMRCLNDGSASLSRPQSEYETREDTYDKQD